LPILLFHCWWPLIFSPLHLFVTAVSQKTSIPDPQKDCTKVYFSPPHYHMSPCGCFSHIQWLMFTRDTKGDLWQSKKGDWGGLMQDIAEGGQSINFQCGGWWTNTQLRLEKPSILQVFLLFARRYPGIMWRGFLLSQARHNNLLMLFWLSRSYCLVCCRINWECIQ
jgi:hypothetical protein